MSSQEQLKRLFTREPSVAQLFRRAHREGSSTKEMLRSLPEKVRSSLGDMGLILEYLPLLHYPQPLRIVIQDAHKPKAFVEVEAPQQMEPLLPTTSAKAKLELASANRSLLKQRYAEPSRMELSIRAWLRDTPSALHPNVKYTQYFSGDDEEDSDDGLVGVRLDGSPWRKRVLYKGRVSTSLASLPRTVAKERTEEDLIPKRSLSLGAGERALLRAMLEGAVADLGYRGSHSGREQRLYRNAVDWFLSPDSSFIFSFQTVCAVLDLDPDFMLEGLRKRGLPPKEVWRIPSRAA